MSLTHCPDCRRLCFINSASCPSCDASFRPGALRAAAASEEKSFMMKGIIMFLVPFLSALALSAVMLMRS